MQEILVKDEIFFYDSKEASAFQRELKAIQSAAKNQWRYRWPDAVRDEVLSRLLALNYELYAQEQSLCKQSGQGPRRPSRTQQTSNEFGAPFPMPGEIQVDLFEPQIEQLELGR